MNSPEILDIERITAVAVHAGRRHPSALRASWDVGRRLAFPPD
jgi:hypothetical protein